MLWSQNDGLGSQQVVVQQEVETSAERLATVGAVLGLSFPVLEGDS